VEDKSIGTPPAESSTSGGAKTAVTDCDDHLRRQEWGGEPDPRHLQKIAVAASFRT